MTEFSLGSCQGTDVAALAMQCFVYIRQLSQYAADHLPIPPTRHRRLAGIPPSISSPCFATAWSGIQLKVAKDRRESKGAEFCRTGAGLDLLHMTLWCCTASIEVRTWWHCDCFSPLALHLSRSQHLLHRPGHCHQ